MKDSTISKNMASLVKAIALKYGFGDTRRVTIEKGLLDEAENWKLQTVKTDSGDLVFQIVLKKEEK
jgi:hypothetical protein